MELFIIYLIMYLIIFCLYILYFVIKNKYKPDHKSIEVLYLESKYKIKVNKNNKRSIYVLISLINSLILVLSYAMFYISDNIFIQILSAFLTVIILVFSLYSLLGFFYKKKR